jgi:hypothetical protein
LARVLPIPIRWSKAVLSTIILSHNRAQHHTSRSRRWRSPYQEIGPPTFLLRILCTLRLPSRTLPVLSLSPAVRLRPSLSLLSTLDLLSQGVRALLNLGSFPYARSKGPSLPAARLEGQTLKTGSCLKREGGHARSCMTGLRRELPGAIRSATCGRTSGHKLARITPSVRALPEPGSPGTRYGRGRWSSRR